MYDNLQKVVPVLAPWTPAILCFVWLSESPLEHCKGH